VLLFLLLGLHMFWFAILVKIGYKVRHWTRVLSAICLFALSSPLSTRRAQH
jgi:hypothetical protein